jgi:PAS domain S-box-containing protein
VRRCISSGLSDHFVDRQGGLLFENTIAPIVEADGSIRTVAMFSRDDTERKRVEDELISLTQRLNDIIDLMPDATFVIDQDKKIIAWNRAIEEMTGVGKDHMLGKGDYEYALPFFDERKPILIDILDMPEAQIETFYKYVNRHSGKIFAESYITRLNNGRGAHLWAVAAPLYDKDGNRFGSIEVIKDMTDLMLKEEARLKTETRYREILEEIDDGYYEVDLMGSFTFFNNTMCRILRYTPDEMIGLNNRTYMDGENAQKVFATFNQVFMTGKPDKAFEWGLIRKDGTRCIVETSVSLMHDDREIATGFRGIARDVTGQKNLQQQLIQAQKMESIGRLTGGIAHDFNNMLTPIMGYAELLLNQLPPDDPRRINVENIIHSAERSRDLVRQLLAFARKQTLEMKPLDINSVITSFEKILRRTLHENLAIETRLQPAIGSILADVGQIEQIIMNLAVNAQDAMPGGGTLFIETGQAYLDETYVAMHKGSTAGDYIMLALSDTGVGMDNAVLSQVFEPFFTTKAPGKGTGLGLSTAYGIVKQHNGYIMVYSEPGRGTIFRIYFPRHGASAQMVVELQEYREGMTGTETIMVIEDEQLVRDLIVSMLKSAGHTVLEAPDGKTALDLAASFPGDIHLVITDMILPDTNGTALFEDLSAMRHGMKVLCMSGYTPDVISHNKLLNSEAPFIQKPFSLQGFAQKVREILDGM